MELYGVECSKIEWNIMKRGELVSELPQKAFHDGLQVVISAVVGRGLIPGEIGLVRGGR